MAESARVASSRREQSARRISTAARTLTATKGFEGFTMDDLAGAAGVSRRTLFNYFDSKIDAVLGPDPDLPAEEAALFRAGGPTGHLLKDLGHLVHAYIEAMPTEKTEIVLMQDVIRNPRIMAACHARFEALTNDVLEMIREREGTEHDEVRARVILGLLLVVCQVSLTLFVEDPDERPFTVHYDHALDSIRGLLV